MQIVLQKEDIEELIKMAYGGVKEVSFNTKSVKATLTVDMTGFVKKQPRPTMPLTADQLKEAQPTKPQQMSNEERAKKGAMAAGGRDRFLQHIG